MRHQVQWVGVGLAVSALLVASPTDAQVVPKLVSVGGFDTRVVTIGLEDRTAGDPAIVLFAGAGSPLEYWRGWLEALAEVGPVVAYDRPGIGQSEYDGLGLSPTRVSEHLDDLLAILQVPPPYILVGHSWGGPLMLHHSEGRTDQIVGMVYLDPTDPLETAMGQLGATTESQYATLMEARATQMASMTLPEGLLAEITAFEENRTTPPGDRGVPRDPLVPTAIVLGRLPATGGPQAPAFMDEGYMSAMMNRRTSRMAEWVTSMERGTLYLTTEAGHNVHIGAQELSLQAVRRVWDAAGSR